MYIWLLFHQTGNTTYTDLQFSDGEELKVFTSTYYP